MQSIQSRLWLKRTIQFICLLAVILYLWIYTGDGLQGLVVFVGGAIASWLFIVVLDLYKAEKKD